MKDYPWTCSKHDLAELFLLFFLLLFSYSGFSLETSFDSKFNNIVLPFEKKTFSVNAPIFDDCGAYIDDWVQNYGGTNSETARSIVEATDGGFYIAGNTLSDDIEVSNNNGGVDFWIIKTDVFGNLLWEKSYGGSSPDTGKSLQATPDGGLIFVGETISSDGDVGGTAGGFDFWVLKLDADGNVQWSNLYGGSKGDNSEWIENTPDGGYIIAGKTVSEDGDISVNKGILDCWLLKIDTDGVIQWSKTFGGSLEDEIVFVQNTNDGGFVVVGNTYSNDGDIVGNHGDLDAIFFKFDGDGNIQWSRTFGGTGMDFAECVRQTLDGGYIITGVTASFDGDFVGNHGSKDAFVIKLDAVGNIQWTEVYGGGAEDGGNVILCNPDGTYVMAGYSFSIGTQVSSNSGLGDVWLVKLANDGTLLAENTFGGTLTEFVRDMRFTQNGGLILCGFTESGDVDFSDNNGQGDFWAAQFAPPSVAPPVANLGEDVIVCQGVEIDLDATDTNCVDCLYEWEDGPTTATRTITAMTSQAFTVTITNSIGCTAEDNIIVGVSNLGVAVTNAVNPSACTDNGLIETTAFGGSGTYTYSWNINDSSPSIYNLEGGEYILTVDDGNCIIEETFDLTTTGGEPPVVELGEDTSICPNGFLILNAQNEGSTYEWNGDANLTDQVLTVATPGTYSIIVTNDEGCTATDEIIINQFTIPNLDLGENIVQCATSVNLESNIDNVNYQWSNEETTSSIIVDNSDEYTLTITDNNGCTVSDAIQVSLNEPPVFDLGENQTSCLSVDLNPSITDVNYEWSTSEETSNIQATTTDWYILTVTDQNNCAYTDSVFVEIVDNLSVDLGENQSSCSTVNLDTGLPNLNYSWSTGETSSSIDVTTSDWYAVTVQDGEGCSANDSVYVTVFPPIEFDLGAPINSCTDVTLSTNLTGMQYAWSTGASSETITTTESDTYAVTVTDGNGCTNSDAIEVTITSNLEIDLGPDTESCIPTTITAGDSFMAYEWIDLNTNQPLSISTPSLEVENSAAYALIVTDNQGCTAADSINITITSNLSLDLGADIMSCGEIILETGNPDAEHEWSTSTDTTDAIMITTTGIVAVTITDDNGCTATDSLMVTIAEDLDLDYITSNISCFNTNDGLIELLPFGGTGNYSYEWETGENSPVLSDLSEGTYSVTLTDENAGCTMVQSIDIIQPEVLSLEFSADMLNCATSQTTIEPIVTGGNGNYAYLWSTMEETSSIEVTEAGIYSLVITDENDCTTSNTIEITTSNSIEATLVDIVDNPCPSDALGSASIEVVQGNGNYTYNWINLTTGITTSNQETEFNNLEAGNYQVVVTDAEQCSETIPFIIGEPTSFVGIIQGEDGCGDNGKASLFLVGGTMPYTYLWSNQATTAEIENLSSGQYDIAVSDANGCMYSDMVEVNNNEFVDFEVDSQGISCDGDMNGSIMVTPINGVMPFSYEWSTGESEASIENLDDGIYTVFVTDANGCSSAGTINLANPAPLGIDVQLSTSNGNNILFVTPFGGTAPYDIDWNNGNTGTFLENPTFDSYTVTVTDANGCTLVETVDAAPTNVDLAEFIIGFDVFPNPNQGQFSVVAEFENWTEGRLSIRNTLGQIILEEEFVSTQLQAQINLPNLSRGLYYVELRSAKKSSYQKVLVQ